MRISLFAVVMLLAATVAEGAELLRFSPQGRTQLVHQVTARFSEPMVRMGEVDAGVPFEIDCKYPGRAQWLGPALWALEFERALPPGARCAFTLKDGLRALSGSQVAPRQPSVVETAGLAARLLHAGVDATEQQVFPIGFNAPVSTEAALASMRCQVGAGQPVAVQAATLDKVRDTYTAQLLDEFVDEWKKEHGAASAAPYVLVRCAASLPPGTKGQVLIDAGLASMDGVRAERSQRLAFSTLPPFGFTVQCAQSGAGVCHPHGDITIKFTAVHDGTVLLQLPDGGLIAPDRPDSEVDRVVFRAPFPQLTNLRVYLEPDLRDTDGRPLVFAGKALLLKTGPVVTSWTMPEGVAVLPANAGARLPIAVPEHVHRHTHRARALRIDSLPDQAIHGWIRRLAAHGQPRLHRKRLLGHAAAPEIMLAPASPDAQHRSHLALPGKGLYVLEWRGGAAAYGARPRDWIRTGALVTDLALHVRQARESSLVWVTSIASGQPVAGVRISVAGARAWRGVTDRDGLARVPFGGAGHSLFVIARTDSDMAFAPAGLASNTGSAGASTEEPEELVATVLDSTLIAPGGTVHMKHLRRSGTAAGLRLAPDRAATVTVRHDASERSFVQTIRWRQGQAAQDWTAPADAPLGSYTVMVDEHYTGEFRIETASPAQTSASVQAPERVIATDPAALATLSVTDLNGGAGYGPVGMRTEVKDDGGTQLPSYAGLTFANGAPAPRQAEVPAQQPAVLTRGVLDKAGQARFALPALPAALHVRRIHAEFDFQDANGSTRSTQQSIVVLPATELMAVRARSSFTAGEAQTIEAIVVDRDARPVAGRTVHLTWMPLKHGEPEHDKEAPICSATTDAAGNARCTWTSDATAALIVARSQAADGAAIAARTAVWAQRESAAVAEPGFALSMPAEAQAPGATARVGVTGGFDSGWMLVAIEREGILDARVVRIDGKLAHIDVPVLPRYAPNVTVHVALNRGTDGGQPGWTSSAASLLVKPDAQALRVTVQADRQVYRPGQTAQVAIGVVAADGGALPPGAQVALAVIDAGLVELVPNPSWDLLGAMMRPRWSGVEELGNTKIVDPLWQPDALAYLSAGNARMALAPPAPFIPPLIEEPGAAPQRSRFQPQLLWRANVKLDAHGRASVPVQLNDALTRLRIVAVANAGADRFGHGSTDVITRQRLELRPLLPPIVRAGDRIQARVMVRNGGDAEVATVAQATLVYPDGARQQLAPQPLRLAPGGAQEVAWTVDVPEQLRGTLAWSVMAGSGEEGDNVRIAQTVLAPERPRTLQAALLKLDQPQRLPLLLPAGATDGELLLALAPSLDGGLPGVRRFFAAYPYSCLEQRISRTVALHDGAGWAAITRDLGPHLDAGNAMLRYFPGQAEAGSDVLSVQLLQLAAHSRFALPDTLEQKLVAGLRQWVQGTGRERDARDLGLRRLAAHAALARFGKVDDNTVDAIEPLLEDWPVAALVDWLTLVRQSGHPQRAALTAAASDALRARLYTQGGALALTGERNELRPWMMGHADVSMARLLLAVRDLPEWSAELPLLARGLMLRQQGGHWQTTLANAWGALAMRSLAAQDGSARLSGTTEVAVGADQRSQAWPAGDLANHRFALPAGAAELHLTHRGRGAPWAALQLVATLPLAQERFNGIRIDKRVTPVEQQVAGQWSRGDVVRVRLELEARADLHWVVVDDPIPPGATVLGSGMKGDSSLLAAGADEQAPTWQERGRDALRSYYRHVGPGKWTLEYLLRLDTGGRFTLPATHAEAMYQPELSGDRPNPPWTVDGPL